MMPPLGATSSARRSDTHEHDYDNHHQHNSAHASTGDSLPRLRERKPPRVSSATNNDSSAPAAQSPVPSSSSSSSSSSASSSSSNSLANSAAISSNSSSLTLFDRIELLLRSRPWLARMYRLYKFGLRLFSGTSELLRLCLRESDSIACLVVPNDGHDELKLIDEISDSNHSMNIDCDKQDHEHEGNTYQEDGSSSQPLLTAVLPKGYMVSPDFIIKVENIILYSRELALERKALMSPECLLSAVIDAIAHKKLLATTNTKSKKEQRRRVVSWELMRLAITALRAQYELRIALDKEASTPCEPCYPAYENQLRALWEGMMSLSPNASSKREFPGIRSDSWTELGFQGKYPSTDFRGTGVLGLDVLVQLSRSKRRDVARRVLRDSEDPESWYSYALVVINVTAYALGALRAGRLRRLLASSGASRETFISFITHVLCVFHARWMSLRATQSITVMDFERVFAETAKSIDDRLLSGETSFAIEMMQLEASVSVTLD